MAAIGSNKRGRLHTALLLLLLPLAALSCSPVQQTRIDIKRDIKIPPGLAETKKEAETPEPPRIPRFVPATVEITPLKTKIVNISARNTPLRDVLHVISEAVNLNVVMERGVDPETPLNLALKNVTAEDALLTVFAAVDYFYVVKDNLLIVKALDSRIFELGHPPLEQRYSIDVGGDILAGSSSAGGSSGAGSATGVKGSVSQAVKSDDAAFKFWDAVEKSIAAILEAHAAGPVASRQSFTVNRLTGAIVVNASKKGLEEVERYINRVRAISGRQVLVEAKIIEVQLNDDFKYGIDWKFAHKGVEVLTNNFASVVSNSGPLFKISVTDDGFSSVLQALEQQGDVRTLSNPRVSIMNGQTALLSVGRNTSFISKVESNSTSGGGAISTTFTVQTSSILSGMLLGIAPHISENGDVSLTITPIVSNLVELTPKTVGSQAAGNLTELSLPTVDLRELNTTVKVPDGKAVVIGGLISKTESLKDSQVPFLGNVPFLGYFFKSRDKQDRKSELVVLLQPFLVSR